MLNQLYDWKRFWCLRTGRFDLSDGGYLSDPESQWGAIQNPDTVPLTSMAMTHRYSFDGALLTTNAVDSIGGADGYVVTLDGSSGMDGSGQAVLSGATSNYVQFPANLVSNYGGVTYELWANVNVNANFI